MTTKNFLLVGGNFINKGAEAMLKTVQFHILHNYPDAKIYVMEDEVAKVSGDAQPMPLTIRVNVGDCVKVKLTNKMKDSRASFSAFGMA